MKICYLNHDIRPDTGAGRFCSALTQAIKEINPDIEVRIITSKDLLSGGVWGLCLKFFKIRSVLKKYEIVHALDGWPYGFIAVIASLGLNKKIIITAVGTGAVQPLYRPIKKWLMIWAYKKANMVMAVSHNTRREILKVVPNLKVEVINHGVDFVKFQISPPTYQEISILKPYILSVGALKKRKGFDYSIKAFKKTVPRFPNLKYVIVGHGPEKENLGLLIKNYQLEGCVIFFDKVTDFFLVSLYKNAQLFILLPQDINKDIEGFGLVFLEAAACGLPVIATQKTSAEDAVRDGLNGILVPPSDYEAAAKALVKILFDSETSQFFSAGSVKFAKEMGWEFAANQYSQIYKKISGLI